MRPFPCLSLLSAALLAACTQFPELDAAVSDAAKAAPYPRLVPAGSLLAERQVPRRLTPEDGPQLMARAERLRRRADILRGLEAVDDRTRERVSGRLRQLGG